MTSLWKLLILLKLPIYAIGFVTILLQVGLYALGISDTVVADPSVIFKNKDLKENLPCVWDQRRLLCQLQSFSPIMKFLFDNFF